MLKLGRSLNLVSSLAAISLWIVLGFFNPYGYQGATEQTYLVAALMMALAVAGLIAGLRVRPGVVLLVAVASFVPIGLYLLGVPGIFRWIGVANVLLLVSGLLMWAGRKGLPGLCERSSPETPAGPELMPPRFLRRRH